MPSPIGHALAGVVAAWTADLVPGGDRRWRTAPPTASWYERAGNGLTMTCAAMAALPDIDLVSPLPVHRAYTHSIGAAFLVTIVAAAVTGWVTWRRQRTKNTEPTEFTENDQLLSLVSVNSVLIVVRVALMCGAAYGTHVLLDWLAVDDSLPYGIRALWPISRGWYISGWNLFPGTARLGVWSRVAMLQNARAVVQEIAILVPIAWLVWLVRVKALARLPSEVPGVDHPAQ